MAPASAQVPCIWKSTNGSAVKSGLTQKKQISFPSPIPQHLKQISLKAEEWHFRYLLTSGQTGLKLEPPWLR